MSLFGDLGAEKRRIQDAAFIAKGLGHVSAAWLHEARGPHGQWAHGSAGGLDAKLSIPAESHGFEGQFAGRDTFIPSMKPAKGVKALSSRGRVGASGTADDPVDVQGNIDHAIILMAQGKHVRLNQVDEVSTLVDKVNQLADDYGKRGKKMPDWDMGKISVAGTNLFTAQTRGIPRVKMPQLTGPANHGTKAASVFGEGAYVDLAEEFRKQLKKEGVATTDEIVPTSHLRATQTELTASSVAGIARAAERGVPKVVAMMKLPLWVSRDNYILDGHHRWAAQMTLDAKNGILGDDTQTEVHRVDMDIGALVPYANQFAQDWGITSVGLGNNALVAEPVKKMMSTEEFEAFIAKHAPYRYSHGWVKLKPDEPRVDESPRGRAMAGRGFGGEDIKAVQSDSAVAGAKTRREMPATAGSKEHASELRNLATEADRRQQENFGMLNLHEGGSTREDMGRGSGRIHDDIPESAAGHALRRAADMVERGQPSLARLHAGTIRAAAGMESRLRPDYARRLRAAASKLTELPQGQGLAANPPETEDFVNRTRLAQEYAARTEKSMSSGLFSDLESERHRISETVASRLTR